MAGRYQGTHLLGDVGGRDHRSIEVFWKHDGWFWWPRHGYAVGPFTTSTAAYQNAKKAAYDSRGCPTSEESRP